MQLLLDDLDIGSELFWEPVRLVWPPPWAGHITFAFWLVKALRPRTLVELGTHTGNSYAAFCQAIAALSDSTRAFAVDTWEGDEHAGFYGNEVFDDLVTFNQAHYASFSTLLRTTFDKAREYFPEGSVDLLHIDGLHSYEAVRHDFDNWRPTLSPKGVVVFHDTNVRERDFGVWRLWRELTDQYPWFEFDHSNGLGVLGVGTELPPVLSRFFEIGRDPKLGGALRRLFAIRCEAFDRRLQAQVSWKDQELGEYKSALSAKELEVAWLKDHELPRYRSALSAKELENAWYGRLLEAKDQLIKSTDALLKERDAGLRAHAAIIRLRDQLLHDRDETLGQRAAQVQALEGQIGEWGRTHADVIRDYEAVLARERQELRVEREARLRDSESIVEMFRQSTSWRLTRPMRVALRLGRRLLGRPQPPFALPIVLPPLLGGPPPVEPGSEETVTVPAAEPTADAKTMMRSVLATRLNTFLTGTGRLRLPCNDPPDISIILVLFNQAELTFGCLSSIAESMTGSPVKIEVVIVDNGSSDETAALLERVDKVKLVRNRENLHFLRGVNRAVRDATGRHLLLLNNDAQLLPGTVEAALLTLASAEDIGAVGGRIILPDGTLQEAGSIVWNDGTCLGYGRGRDPSDPEFMFRRDVDYCSGAFLLTPRRLWDQLGGFDESYAPAYYEETDYCLRLWQSGFRVIYEPDVLVLHYEFGSASGNEQALALQQRNWRIFAERHAEWLRRQLPPSPANAWLARTARRLSGRLSLRRVLMIEDRVPKPELGAGYPRSNELLRQLVVGGAQVTFFPTFRVPETWPAVRRAVGPEVEVLIRAQSDQLRPFLLSRRDQFDAILICRPHNMRFFLDAIAEDRGLIGPAKLIYDAEAVFAEREALRAEVLGEPMTPEERERRIAEEVTLTRDADTVITVSPAEQRLFERHGVKQVHLLGHVIEPDPTAASWEVRTDILFVGAMAADDEPNADSLRWFAEQVLPLLRRQLGRDIRLTVVGRNQSPSVQALDGTAFDIIGQVDDLEPWFKKARVMVVPTRYAAGIPHKAHTAAAAGVPIVATELVAAQLGWVNGRDLLAASDAAGFAKACVKLYEEEILWGSVRQAALERCREDCSMVGFRKSLLDILGTVPVTDRNALLDERLRVVAPAPPLPDGELPGFVGRCAATDYSVAVPFGYRPEVAAPGASVAVVCHIYHIGLAGEIRQYLDNIPFPADLFVSTDTEMKRAQIARHFADWSKGDVAMRITPNRGRDIAPKLVGCREAHERYEYVLHLHSKQSRHDQRLAHWRGFLFENLLGSSAVVCSVFEAFARNPQLGMIAPQHYECVRRWLDWGGNYGAARTVAARMGIRISPKRALDFPSGSMFWARAAALKPLLDLHLAADDFPGETGQVDGTPAHAIERLYFLICEKAGYHWLKIARPELYVDTSTIVPIDSPMAFDRFVADHGVVLSGLHPPDAASELPDIRSEVSPGLLAALASRREKLTEAAE